MKWTVGSLSAMLADTRYNGALRQLGNRLVGILHGCLKPTPATTRPMPGTNTPNGQQLDV